LDAVVVDDEGGGELAWRSWLIEDETVDLCDGRFSANYFDS
jgi:hypothetical protein